MSYRSKWFAYYAPELTALWSEVCASPLRDRLSVENFGEWVYQHSSESYSAEFQELVPVVSDEGDFSVVSEDLYTRLCLVAKQSYVPLLDRSGLEALQTLIGHVDWLSQIDPEQNLSSEEN